MGGGGKSGSSAPSPSYANAHSAELQAQADRIREQNIKLAQAIKQKNAENARIAREAKAKAAAKAKQAEEARLAEGRASRDTAIANREGARNTATTRIDTTIAKERANADLRGVVFRVNPEDRQARINKQFSKLFSKDQQTQLDRLIKEFGAPDGYVPDTTPRGTASTTPAPTKSSTAANTLINKKHPNNYTLLTDNSNLGLSNTILG